MMITFFLCKISCDDEHISVVYVRSFYLKLHVEPYVFEAGDKCPMNGKEIEITHSSQLLYVSGKVHLLLSNHSNKVNEGIMKAA